MNEEVIILTKRSALDEEASQHISSRFVKEEEVKEYVVDMDQLEKVINRFPLI